MIDMTFHKMMIDETFCFFAKHLHIGMFWFDVFKKRNHDYTLYTSKEIDRFGIKDKIKIGYYKLKFISGGKKLSFSFFSKCHNWKIVIHAIFYH